MAETWREPARELPVIGRPDVLVVGAGSAGIAAALASAYRGAETWLVERLSVVGGLATFGLINLLLTLDDGEGTQVVAGLCQDFVDELRNMNIDADPDAVASLRDRYAKESEAAIAAAASASAPPPAPAKDAKSKKH